MKGKGVEKELDASPGSPGPCRCCVQALRTVLVPLGRPGTSPGVSSSGAQYWAR